MKGNANHIPEVARGQTFFPKEVLFIFSSDVIIFNFSYINIYLYTHIYIPTEINNFTQMHTYNHIIMLAFFLFSLLASPFLLLLPPLFWLLSHKGMRVIPYVCSATLFSTHSSLQTQAQIQLHHVEKIICTPPYFVSSPLSHLKSSRIGLIHSFLKVTIHNVTISQYSPPFHS